jgi:argininosuccinate lyase
MAVLWKQDVPLDPTFAPINASLREDWFLLPYEIRLQRAHALTLEAAGILTSSERRDVDRGLDQIESRFGQSPCPTSDAEDLHTWIECSLVELIGETGKKVHTARSRNDQVATLLLLYLIAEGEGFGRSLSSLVALCCRRALEWREDLFPLQTHAQFAVPGTVGFWILRYAVSLDRIRGHAAYFRNRWREFCPLGSGAAAGSSIPIDRRVQARELGFEQPSLSADFAPPAVLRRGRYRVLANAVRLDGLPPSIRDGFVHDAQQNKPGRHGIAARRKLCRHCGTP